MLRRRMGQPKLTTASRNGRPVAIIRLLQDRISGPRFRDASLQLERLAARPQALARLGL